MQYFTHAHVYAVLRTHMFAMDLNVKTNFSMNMKMKLTAKLFGNPKGIFISTISSGFVICFSVAGDDNAMIN